MPRRVEAAQADGARHREGGTMFRTRMFGFVTLLIVATSAVHGQTCEDPAGECNDIPCPCANLCNDASDCADWMECVSPGTSAGCSGSGCYCDERNGWQSDSDLCLSICAAQVPSLFFVDKSSLSWVPIPIPPSVAYDIIRGEGFGDFALTTKECLADDHPSTTFSYGVNPPPGEAFWFLVRLGVAGDPHSRLSPVSHPPELNGSYDTRQPGQLGWRDAEIAASGNDCS